MVRIDAAGVHHIVLPVDEPTRRASSLPIHPLVFAPVVFAPMALYYTVALGTVALLAPLAAGQVLALRGVTWV